ncbi:MBL fold metallo-hydrolase [Bradyrhizobium sp. CCGB12]|uniref:MBL fold metallo-hydrolase n=1 Tax=Bradyrhizobium sp. CCGB12 TaxID=2949632 RepID=UPI0020B3CAAB|nr:MBL fold metallo-hydrolase [Bradyrhizobium sp. CCGB12]MCP3392057.1 MBL fold metallo-hydrolase [Bradyrhizobium sp. CCGB12]
MKITLLPSEKGDCLLIESDDVAILADGGMPGSYAAEVRPFLGRFAAAGGELDLVYVSHVDQDHIAGVLQLLEDKVQWRVHKHKVANNRPSTKPKFDEPPVVKRIWHNSFKALVPQNAGEIGTMLAARANTLSSSGNPAAIKLAAAYSNIANSIPEAIKVSRRIAADQLDIPLNGEFNHLLAMVRGNNAIRLKPGSKLSIRVIGPFEKDLEILRDYWNAWLMDVKNANAVRSLKEWLENNRAGLPAGTLDLSIDDEIGRRAKVTEPNLASLMLLLEETKAGGGVTRAIMTGDGHHEDILAGLEHHGLLADGKGLHVDLLKIQHHGSEHNLDRDFVKRITADHYVFCANGEHENPDLRIIEVLLKSRLGGDGELSPNPEAGQSFTVWLNCSSQYLKKQIEAKEEAGKSTAKLEKSLEHFLRVEEALTEAKAESGGKLKVKALKANPLVLEI